MLKVTIKNAEGQEILSEEGEKEIAFLYERTYEEGDCSTKNNTTTREGKRQQHTTLFALLTAA